MKNTIKSIRVRVFDEINIGDSVYRIVEITPDSVIGKKIVKHGHLVESPLTYSLDLRLSGWEFLSRPLH